MWWFLLLLLHFSRNFGHSSWLSGSQLPDLVLNLGHDGESTGLQPLDNQGMPSKSLLAATWTDLKGIMLREISQRKTNTIWNHLHVKPKRIQWTSDYASKEEGDIEKKLVITRGWAASTIGRYQLLGVR